MKENNFGEQLKARRKEKGLTLAKLSELTGVHTTHLGRIERGERFPSASVLQKMAAPLGYDERQLLKLAGYLSPDETDDRIDKFKLSLKGEIKTAMSTLMDKVDTL